MDAMQFVEAYVPMLEEIDQVVHPDFYPIMRQLYRIDPHDLIEPHQCFATRDAAFGFVFRMVAKRAAEMRKIMTSKPEAVSNAN